MLAAADPEKGKLRTFLLTCTRNYMADQRDRQMAQKRGGGLQVHMDPALAEERYAAEPVDDLSPDRLFQRGWAMSVLEHALGLLEEEFSEEGKGKLFEALRPFLGLGPEPEKRYDEIADTLAIPVGTLKSHVHRLRARWCELLFEEVAKTLDDPTAENIKAELVELLGCV
jgi:RNA polymerase sigma-70 factor (ECF subfamily)